ncbi:MAG: RNA polymerase sigma factor [Paludibacteraceae bacterium]|nr:RNA polymerase sigma factor [Paludibacteraceae bacterium]MBO7636340.1 RNA polymerase sigma factor [Paludibacteraceae bacterium]MBR5971214.1 RNA polymerase sigma factor [Paludibacteraceae bacterium]
MESLNYMTDDELVQLYADNNNDAFDVLLMRYKNKVFSYIYTATKDKDEANDLFQETFIKAIMTIRQGKYSEKGKFASWLLRIAHNLIIDTYRKGKNENTISNEEYGTDLLNDIKLYDDSLEEYWAKENALNGVVELIDQLPENQQTIVRKRFFKDLSFKEIAEEEGISINTALGRMRYALINLKKLATENKIFMEV